MKHMRNITLAVVVGTIPFLAGCGSIPIVGAYIDPATRNYQADSELIQQRQKIAMEFNNRPDTDAWHEQRSKISLAMGDRVFDKDFGRVYDSLTLAASSLELKVSNMERTSGYISASGITLSPTEADTIYRQAVNEWCQQKGYDASVLDKQFKTADMANVGAMIDSGTMMQKYKTMQKTLTFQLVKMGDNQTKVKLRFADVYFPGEVEAYYKLVWRAVDKQIFVDQNIDGGVEKRN